MSEEIFQDLMAGFGSTGDLASWVDGKCKEYRDHYESNYADKHDEYMRIFRNQWAPEDKGRDSERSRLIAPATAQAVESSVAEVEEATFGRGKLFDIREATDPNAPPELAQKIELLKNKLHDDFAIARVRSSVAEVLLNAAVFGTGVAEIVIDEVAVRKPASRPTMEGAMQEFGIEETIRPLVKLNPVMPKNFLIDPYATNVDDALGVAIDEFVSRHIVEELQEQGIYKADAYIGNAANDTEIQIDPLKSNEEGDKIRLTKWYGKVPRDLLIADGVDEDEIDQSGQYVEAIVVMANGATILKAIPSPYMCQDRPVVAFQWDIVPSQFHGRGVCEKTYMSQKALDTEMRARVDGLALTVHPMLAADATRMPRDKKLEVRPGRMILTNGNPAETLMPFNFGQMNPTSFQQSAALQAMVTQAAGAGDGMGGNPTGDNTAAGMSMSQGAIIKRQKRTLLNFQENFLIPFIRRAAHRYMQFDPENYPIQDYTFIPFSSLGAMAREYEVGQLSQILQMVPPDSPAHGAIIKGIIEHLNVSNREELIAAIESGNQPPSPEQQQQQQQMQQMEIGLKKGQIDVLTGQAMEMAAKAQKYGIEAQLYPQELTLKYADNDNDGNVEQQEFENKLKMSDMLLKEAELQLKQDVQLTGAQGKAEAELVRSLEGMAKQEGPQGPPQAPQGPQGPPQGM